MEVAHIHTQVESDGKIRLELAVPLDPGSDVEVSVSASPRLTFATKEAWQAHVDRIAGSIPDLERPPQGTLRPVEPL